MKDWQKQALELASKGITGRASGRILGKNESVVRRFLAKYKTNPQPKKQGAKILLIDIESAPELSYHFGRFNQNISQSAVVHDPFLICYSAQWIGNIPEGFNEKESFMGSKEDIARQCDEVMAGMLFALLDEADIVVAHNANGFDKKMINTALIRNGYPPPSPYKVVDTLGVAKSVFRFPSNKLDSIAHLLKLERKLDNSGMSLWVDVLNGCDKARKTMQEYNDQDVVVLKQVFEKLQSWNNTSPNMAQYYDDNVVRCVKCGSDNLVPAEGFSYTGVSKFAVYRCNDCGGISRSRVNLNDKDKRGSLLMNVGG